MVSGSIYQTPRSSLSYIPGMVSGSIYQTPRSSLSYLPGMVSGIACLRDSKSCITAGCVCSGSIRDVVRALCLFSQPRQQELQFVLGTPSWTGCWVEDRQTLTMGEVTLPPTSSSEVRVLHHRARSDRS